MSVRHSTQFVSSLISAQNKVGSVPLHNGVCSLIVSGDLDVDIYNQLAKQFQLTQYNADIDLSCHDAFFNDCRGTKISCPVKTMAAQPIVTIALVDENSFLPPNSVASNPKLELTTEAELNSAVLKLRLDACRRQQSRPANADCSDTSFIQDNAYEILQAFVQHSTDWIVVKDLNHRFMIASDRFLKSQDKSAHEIIGKNDLEIGTSRELVLGNGIRTNPRTSGQSSIDQ